MGLLDREYFTDFFRIFAMLFLAIAIIHFASKMVDYSSELFASGGDVFHWVLLCYAYQMPLVLIEAGVVLTSASILWNVTRRTRTNELLACMAAGISPMRLAMPFIVASALISVMNLVLAEKVIGHTERTAQYIEERWIKGKEEERLTTVYNLFQIGARGRIYSIEEYRPSTGQMLGVTITDPDFLTGNPQTILSADSAQLEEQADGSSIWVFRNARLTRLGPEMEPESFERHEVLLDTELERPMEPHLREFLNTLGEPSKMTISELLGHIRVLDAQGKPFTEYTLMVHTRIAMPLAALVMGFVMCAHVMRPRSQSVMHDFGGGMLMIALYYGALVWATRAGRVDLGVHPGFLAWAPNVLFLAAGVVMFWKNRR